MDYGRQIVSFAGFEVDPRAGEIRRNGQRIKLQNQPFQVLIALLEKPGELVTREALRQRLWPANTFVDFDNGLNIAVRKLRHALDDDVERPRSIETLPGRGYRVIGPVERIPEASRHPVSIEVPVVPPHRTRLWAVLPISLCLALLAGALIHERDDWHRTQTSAVNHSPIASPRVSPPPVPSIAVLGFSNLSSLAGTGWFARALSEQLAMELASGGQLRTIPAEDVARATRALALPDADSYAADTLARIRQTLGADYVVEGSYFVAGLGPQAHIRINFRLQDSRSGSTLASLSETGARDKTLDLIASAGAALREKLGFPTVVWSQAGSFPAGVVFDGANFWVAASDSNRLLKLRKDGGQLSSFPVTHPYGLAYDGSSVWATNPDLDRVTKVDGSTGRVLGAFPVGAHPAGILFDGRNIWVANFRSKTVTKLTLTGTLLGTFPVGRNPHDLAYDGAHVWVTNEFSDSVTKLSIDGDRLGTYDVGRQPWGLVFDGANIWVANQNSNNVMELNLDGVVINTIPTGSGPHGLVFDGTYVWALCFNDGSVTKIQARTATVVGKFPTGGSGPQLAASDGVHVWVANTLSGTVSRM